VSNPLSAALAAALQEEAKYDWVSKARPDQLPPPGDWLVWFILAGRGWGKTRTGAETAKGWAGAASLPNLTSMPGSRGAIVAPTFGDGRDTCIEGESGLLSVLPPGMVKNWNRSLGELDLTNGTHIKVFSADKPDGLRGPAHSWAWCDELAAWRYPETWHMLMYGLRVQGGQPRVVVTTTPRPTALVRELHQGDGITAHVTRGSTFDNEANLAATALAFLKERYEGTRLGRQELYAAILDDVPGALWQRAQIDALRVKVAPELVRVVVAVDPAVTSGEHADETGIVVAGVDEEGEGYILADYSCRESPDGWARRAVRAYHEHHADRIVAERNQGGDLVESCIRTVEPTVSFKSVVATRGKHTRAEPVSALYEQGRIHHVGSFTTLEDQMCAFLPDGRSGLDDRVDAVVWAMTELNLGGAGMGDISDLIEANKGMMGGRWNVPDGGAGAWGSGW
jgi:predicted phage terminase large subunit-like protein